MDELWGGHDGEAEMERRVVPQELQHLLERQLVQVAVQLADAVVAGVLLGQAEHRPGQLAGPAPRRPQADPIGHQLGQRRIPLSVDRVLVLGPALLRLVPLPVGEQVERLLVDGRHPLDPARQDEVRLAASRQGLQIGLVHGDRRRLGAQGRVVLDERDQRSLLRQQLEVLDRPARRDQVALDTARPQARVDRLARGEEAASGRAGRDGQLRLHVRAELLDAGVLPEALGDVVPVGGVLLAEAPRDGVGPRERLGVGQQGAQHLLDRVVGAVRPAHEQDGLDVRVDLLGLAPHVGVGLDRPDVRHRRLGAETHQAVLGQRHRDLVGGHRSGDQDPDARLQVERLLDRGRLGRDDEKRELGGLAGLLHLAHDVGVAAAHQLEEARGLEVRRPRRLGREARDADQRLLDRAQRHGAGGAALRADEGPQRLTLLQVLEDLAQAVALDVLVLEDVQHVVVDLAHDPDVVPDPGVDPAGHVPAQLVLPVRRLPDLAAGVPAEVEARVLRRGVRLGVLLPGSLQGGLDHEGDVGCALLRRSGQEPLDVVGAPRRGQGHDAAPLANLLELLLQHALEGLAQGEEGAALRRARDAQRRPGPAVGPGERERERHGQTDGGNGCETGSRHEQGSSSWAWGGRCVERLDSRGRRSPRRPTGVPSLRQPQGDANPGLRDRQGPGVDLLENLFEFLPPLFLFFAEVFKTLTPVFRKRTIIDKGLCVSLRCGAGLGGTRAREGEWEDQGRQTGQHRSSRPMRGEPHASRSLQHGPHSDAARRALATIVLDRISNVRHAKFTLVWGSGKLACPQRKTQYEQVKV